MERILIVAALTLAASPLAPAQTTGRQAGQQANQNPARGQASPGATAQSQLPAGWRVTGNDRENYELTVDTSVRRGGRASASLTPKSDPQAGKFGAMVQTFKADQYRGKRLRFSGHVKAEGAGGKARLWMRVDGADGRGLTFDNMEERAEAGTFDWKRQEIVLDVPAEAQAIYLGALFGGKGRIWVDDLRLEVVGADVASTNMMSSPEAKRKAEEDFEKWKSANKEEFEKAEQGRKERLLTMPTQPVNLDFESK